MVQPSNQHQQCSCTYARMRRQRRPSAPAHCLTTHNYHYTLHTTHSSRVLVCPSVPAPQRSGHIVTSLFVLPLTSSRADYQLLGRRQSLLDCICFSYCVSFFFRGWADASRVRRATSPPL